MTRQAILKSLDLFFSLPAGTLTGTEPLGQLNGWDSSLGVLEMLAFLDRSFGRTVSAEQVTRCQNVDDIVTLAHDRKAA